MRYTPFGSGSIVPGVSASLADYAVTASFATLTDYAVYALSGSKGAAGDACVQDGPYDSYPPTYS